MLQFIGLWKKWSWAVVLLLGVFSAYKVFTPAEVKIIKTEHTQTITDTTEISRLKSQVNKLKQTVKAYSQSVSEDEVRTEVRYPDGRVEIRVEKKKTTNTTGSSSTVEKSSATTDSSHASTGHSTTETDTKETKVTNPNPFTSTAIGFQYRTQQILLGQGINIGKGWTGMVLGSYSFRDGLSGTDRLDVGGMIVLRY